MIDRQKPNKKHGRPKYSNKFYGKCDVRLDKKELEMLDHLSELNEITISSILIRRNDIYVRT